MSSSAPGRGLARPPWRLASYLVAALAVSFPLVLHPGGAVISHWDVDVIHGLWINWWFARVMEGPGHTLFTTNLVAWPWSVDLQLADLNLAVNLPFYALQKLFGAFAAWNLLALASFVLAAATLERLARRLGAHASAAWLAGLVFAASPYWLASLLNAWLCLIHVWVLPLALLAALRAFERRDAASAAAAGGAAALAFHVSPYYFVFLAVLGAALLPWYARALAPWLRAGGARVVLLALAVAGLLVAPRALPMLAASRADLVSHHGPLDPALGAPLSELVWPSAAAVATRVPDVGYLVVFLGFTVLAVVAAGLAVGRERRRHLPWLVSAGLLLVLALGPYLKLSEAAGATALPLPGLWLQRLPGFRAMTNHWRWALPGVLCLDVVFAGALCDLQDWLRARWRVPTPATTAAVLVAFALEVGLVFPLPARKPLWARRPFPIARVLRDAPEVRAIWDPSDLAKLNQMVHGKPIATAWLPRIDRATALRVAERNRAFQALGSVEARARFVRAQGFDALVLGPRSAVLVLPDRERPDGVRLRLVRVPEAPAEGP